VVVSKDTVLIRRREVESRIIAEGAVLVNMTSGACFELNPVGCQVWDLLTEGSTLPRICDVLEKRYEVERAVLESDFATLVESLKVAGLVEIVSPVAGQTR
jgi:hypothetical protein